MLERIGFIQGRLCALIENKIQAFPWRDWEIEFSLAELTGMSLMEWTLDKERLSENPLMTAAGRSRILYLSKKHNVRVASLTADCVMQEPFWKAENKKKKELKSNIISIGESCHLLGINTIVIPLVDNGRLETPLQEKEVIDFFLSECDTFNKYKIRIAFEIDYCPSEARRFINNFKSSAFGINYDIGNSACLGFSSAEEFMAYGHRIINVHVKDRVLAGGTVPLTHGSADFFSVFRGLYYVAYNGNFILQTARAKDGSHLAVIRKYRNMVINWIHESSAGSANNISL